MDANSVNQNTANRVSSWMHPIPTVSSLVGFFLGDSNMKRILLTQGKYALVDDDDFERVNRWKWCASKTNQGHIAMRKHCFEKNKWVTLKMHRFIMNPPRNLQIDHKNHEKLDNRKCNLRICTATQNAANQKPRAGYSSKYKGVRWREDEKVWVSEIKINRKRIYIGRFKKQLLAAIAYDAKAKELFGEFAYTNAMHFPELRKEFLPLLKRAAGHFHGCPPSSMKGT